MGYALDIMRAPKLIQLGTRNAPATTITHRAELLGRHEKTTWLVRHLRRSSGPTLVFSATKRGADRLARELQTAGVKTTALHADRTQQDRLRAVEGFRSGTYRVLVATDIAARGLDIDGIEQVINYEVPFNREGYVHRVGRTGRATAKGVAITLVAPDERQAMDDIAGAFGLVLFEDAHAELAAEQHADGDGSPSGQRPTADADLRSRLRPWCRRLMGPMPRRSGGGGGGVPQATRGRRLHRTRTSRGRASHAGAQETCQPGRRPGGGPRRRPRAGGNVTRHHHSALPSAQSAVISAMTTSTITMSIFATAVPRIMAGCRWRLGAFRRAGASALSAWNI